MNADTLNVLKEAKGIIEQPHAWTKHEFKARVREAPGGVAFCATGAVYEAATRILGLDRRSDASNSAMGTLAACLPDWERFDGVVSRFNDAQAEVGPVLELFDCAIEKVQSMTEVTV